MGADADVVRELARRFAAGDMEGAFALYHPDFRIEQPPSFPHGGWFTGTDGLGEMAVRFGAVWDRVIENPRLHDCHDGTVVQITTQTWTAHATGRAATVDVVELFTVTDGMISEIRVFQQDSHLLLGTLDPDRPSADRG